jgi:hypothetical protein
MSATPTEIEALARTVWGTVNEGMSARRRGELRFGAHGSKALRIDTGMWFDHEANAGGGFGHLYKIAHGRYPEPNGHDPAGQHEFRVPKAMASDLGQPVAWWDYHDAAGQTVGRVVRFQPSGRGKEYRQCKPSPNGWRWKMDSITLPLCRFPALLRARHDATVFITEGEKQADALAGWGLIATTNAGGAGKFRSSHAKTLVGRSVAVLPDNDPPGRHHARRVVAELHAVGVEACVIELPGLPEKGDLIEWIEDGGTAEALADLVAVRQAITNPAEHETAEADPMPDPEENFEAEILRLAALPIARYERLRGEASQRLKVRASFLDRMVCKARGTEDTQQGRALDLRLPEAWPHPVDGAKLLFDLAEYFARHAFLPAHASTALALWTVHTFAFELFEHTPRLHIRAIAKNSGKTTVLDLLQSVVCRPLQTAHATSSALFRAIEMAKPTLLIDEADTFIREAEEVRGIINAGHKRGQQLLRTVGDTFEPRAFGVFAPVAIAGIGTCPVPSPTGPLLSVCGGR